jgi:hypothetical protein
MDDIFREKGEENFNCKICDFVSSDKWKYERHLLTLKHKKRTTEIKMEETIGLTTEKIFKCECGNSYKHRQGLWKHSKNCNYYNKNTFNKYFKNNDELIEAILKDNQEFKQMLIDQNNKLIELATNKNTVINNTTNNNTTNNNFNLQMFLNVQCKDALNISDFLDSLQVKIKDLEDTGRLGYVDGITKIFLNGLNDLNINSRPIHCSDLKREVIYIKDKDVWEKENNDRDKLKLAIKTITSKNIKQIPVWQKENPDCFDSTSKKNDQYLKIVSNAMNGLTKEETEKNYDKIISKIAKETVIQKNII